MYIGGLDVGTTGCKIAVFDSDGCLINTYYTEYSSNHSDGNHEIDFNDVKNGVLSILKEAANEYKLEALGVTSFGETFAMLDENDNILAPSMLYTDPRGYEECDKLTRDYGRDNMIKVTGVAPDKMYSIFKIMWLKNNKPDLFNKCSKILLGEDFVVYILTGQRKIDYSLAARTSAFNIVTKTWQDDIFSLAEVPISLMSEPVETGSIAGTLSDGIKDILGISYDIKVVCACHDQIAAMIGSGVFESGIAMDGTGTVECIPVVLDKIPDDKNLYDCGYSVVPFINGKYACYALSFTGGATLKWFRDNFAEKEAELCMEKGINVYAYLDRCAPKEPTKLLILPHFAGAATPYMDSESTAAILGITLETTKLDIYRALMEGTSYEILLNFNMLKSFTGEVREIRATGGGASSDIWLQIKADILNTKICSMSNKEIGASGTAAVAGVACGIYLNLPQIIEKMSQISKEFTPIKENSEIYKRQYDLYKNLYGALKSVKGV